MSMWIGLVGSCKENLFLKCQFDVSGLFALCNPSLGWVLK